MAAFQGIVAIVYDLDGTVINSQKIHGDGWKHACNVHGVAVTDQMLMDQKGMGLTEAAKMMIGYNYQVDREEFTATQREYTALHLPQAGLYPSFIQTYDTLVKRGNIVWVCTSTEKEMVESVLQNHQDLFQRLDGKIVWREMYTNTKPSPDPLLLTLKKMGKLKPEQSLYIGDAFSDYTSASSAGLRFCYFCPPNTQVDDKIPRNVQRITMHSQLLKMLG